MRVALLVAATTLPVRLTYARSIDEGGALDAMGALFAGGG